LIVSFRLTPAILPTAIFCRREVKFKSERIFANGWWTGRGTKETARYARRQVQLKTFRQEMAR
jgi:hypothetical protein